MHQTNPAPAQAECLTAFARLRAGSPQDAFEIGEGCNFYPPSPDLGRHLGVLLHNLAARSSLSRYSDPFNGGAKAAFAELTSARLGIPLTRQDITFVQGGTEAVSLTIGHLAATGHSLTLPIPNYYGFDQSAARRGAPVAAYYRHDGAVHLNGAQPDRPFAKLDPADGTLTSLPVLVLANALYDPLMVNGDNGAVKPYLAKAFTSNADATAWTLELREGVKFSDGKPLDAPPPSAA
ncbi:ABC transporter substrate-binding protein [Kitasatospora sp. NPDC088779]|uniref:ABC transporter substrate-binding protein n=1 Tax=Kitasatospora sp. NPDC088779 TaxID=3154964 RepID=UPI0034431673